MQVVAKDGRPHLHLQIEERWTGSASPILAQLLRYCPNLRVPDIHYDKYFPNADIARILPEDCPKLHTNKCHASKTYCRKR